MAPVSSGPDWVSFLLPGNVCSHNYITTQWCIQRSTKLRIYFSHQYITTQWCIQILTKLKCYFLTNMSPHSGACKYLLIWELIFSQIYHHTVVHTNNYVVENLFSHKYITTQWCIQILTKLRIEFLTNISSHTGAINYLPSWEFIFSKLYHHTVVHTKTYEVEEFIFSQIHHHTVLTKLRI